MKRASDTFGHAVWEHLVERAKKASDPHAFSLHQQKARSDLMYYGPDIIIKLVQHIQQIESECHPQEASE